MENRNPSSRRIALLVQYDGSAFSGYQLQENSHTVQAELENALALLTREKIRVTASGRTDSGVHALGQVVHFDTASSISLQRLVIGMNGILKPQVSVRNAYNVPTDFHARFDAREREYIYLIYTYPQRTPFMCYRAMWLHDGISADFMRKVGEYLVGEMDYASFCKKNSASLLDNTVRRILEISVEEHGDYISLRIRGTAFLHNMIRIIVGTMVEMWRDGRDPGDVVSILDRKDRDAGGFTAPPYGLYLKSVSYDPPLRQYPAAFPESGRSGHFFI